MDSTPPQPYQLKKTCENAGIAWSVYRLATGWSSSPGRVKNFLFSMSFGPALGPMHPPIQGIPGALSPGGG
jgi:hypothetical protein